MKELQMKQNRLDKFVCENNNIENPGDLVLNKITALDVEFGELANEIQFFKHWKKNKLIDKAKVIEEACDCLHFILSLANDNDVNLQVMAYGTFTREIDTLYRYIKATLWKDIYLEDKWEEGLKRILMLLVAMIEELDFTYSDLLREYDRKYEINIKRQKEGY